MERQDKCSFTTIIILIKCGTNFKHRRPYQSFVTVKNCKLEFCRLPNRKILYSRDVLIIDQRSLTYHIGGIAGSRLSVKCDAVLVSTYIVYTYYLVFVGRTDI